jgi:glycosyltransferase involved in cell wall biosynthesis
MADALAPEVARFVNAERVVTIPDPFLDDDTIFAERAFTTPGKPLNLLVVGRLEPQKDPQLAIAVAGALKASGQDIRLTILGGGPMKDVLQAQIERAGLARQVLLAGYATDPHSYYRAADLLLMTSRFEGVPAVIGEALTHGLSFVATDCSSWLTALARENPALGTVLMERQPDMLASAAIARSKLPPPSAEQIETGIGAHRAGPAARAYLDLFDSLT